MARGIDTCNKWFVEWPVVILFAVLLPGTVFLKGGLFMGAEAHVRFTCPPPRSDRTNEKVGPCDAADNGMPAFELQPGLNTIKWEETINHPGAPTRFALSLDGVDDGYEDCVLLDHVPHNDAFSNTYGPQPTTPTQYSITLYIPDVACERCTLQMISVMSDEVHGVPYFTSCAYQGAQDKHGQPTCQQVYHSCAVVKINGSKPRNELAKCPSFNQQLQWPFMNGQTPSVYNWKGDPGTYNKQGVLESVTRNQVLEITPAQDAPYLRSVGGCANY